MHIKNSRSPNTVVISITHSVFVSHVAFNLVALNLSDKYKQTVDDRVTKYTIFIAIIGNQFAPVIILSSAKTKLMLRS